MGKNKDNNGVQQGPVDHANSLHGKKTLSRLNELTNSSDPERGRTGQQFDPEKTREHNHPGGNRLFEDRQQHDDADQQSEKTRLARDIERHHHGPGTELHHRDVQSSAKRKN
jgi:hypothetical protein